ncbi:hypothetical protein BOX15_Mlig013306g1, partial [Macrostomum lignano]
QLLELTCTFYSRYTFFVNDVHRCTYCHLRIKFAAIKMRSQLGSLKTFAKICLLCAVFCQLITNVDCCPKRIKKFFKKVKTHNTELVGCYPDRPHARDLPIMGKRSTEMTLAACLKTCVAWDTKFLGLQGGNACWCGQSHGNHGEKLPNSDCSLPCNGQPEITCGGPMHNNVYKIT